jgi:16S rRNA (cytosine967-C5)-methyltransferase
VTPGARLQSAIELLDELAADARPVDRTMRQWFAERRFAGAKDRRTISRRVYTVIRGRARLDWWCARHLGTSRLTNRVRVIASLVLTDGLDEAVIAGLFDGSPYKPTLLTEDERMLIDTLSGHMLDSAEQPESVRGEYPDWLGESLYRAFDGAVVTELQALNRPAPLDVRVNLLMDSRDNALAQLGSAGVTAVPLPFSSAGLRIPDRPRIDNTDAYRSGLVEVQDEGSQLVATITAAEPGMTVVDYCAGAGGKTLSLAVAMAGQGHLIACDSEPRRLARMAPRLKRAGIEDFVDVRVLDGAAALADVVGRADRVLADVPCSMSGAWRRDPAAKWRLSRSQLDGCVAAQKAIIDEAARLVRPGGRLVYATCSVLPEENEAQADGFLDRHPEFELLPANDVWDSVVAHACPSPGPYLRLSPARSQTDGYFVAVFRRRAE